MKNILLVDDENSFLLSLSEGLGHACGNIGILTACDGSEAIEILRSSRVDLLVTDLNMPVVDGFELLEYILKQHPRLPVIVMTAYTNLNVIERLNSLGFVHYMEKPLEFDDLLTNIRLLLDNGETIQPCITH